MEKLKEGKKLMEDVDHHSKTNSFLRLSSDPSWMKYYLIVEGPLLWGLDPNGNPRAAPDESLVGHDALSYGPWEFNWPDRKDGVCMIFCSLLHSLSDLAFIFCTLFEPIAG